MSSSHSLWMHSSHLCPVESSCALSVFFTTTHVSDQSQHPPQEYVSKVYMWNCECYWMEGEHHRLCWKAEVSSIMLKIVVRAMVAWSMTLLIVLNISHDKISSTSRTQVSHSTNIPQKNHFFSKTSGWGHYVFEVTCTVQTFLDIHIVADAILMLYFWNASAPKFNIKG